LANRTYPAGEHTFSWDGTDEKGLPVPSGVYICRLEAGKKVMTRKMVLER
jgi:flagellar hook assembly protein FlgD